MGAGDAVTVDVVSGVVGVGVGVAGAGDVFVRRLRIWLMFVFMVPMFVLIVAMSPWIERRVPFRFPRLVVMVVMFPWMLVTVS